jgi:hypothetical protein
METKNVFAQRILHWSSKQLVVKVGAPATRFRGTQWYCWLDIKLKPGKRVHHERVIGEDGWQSLLLAMSAAQQIIEEKYPDAYAFEPNGGTFFPLIVHESLPHEYFIRLREHLEAECVRKTEEFGQDMIKRRRAGDPGAPGWSQK